MDALIASRNSAVATAGAVANAHASANLFADYRSRLAANMPRRQDAALSAYYLCSVKATDSGNLSFAEALATAPAAWSGMTWELIAGFARWLLARGYAIGTVNGPLCAVKV